MSGETAEVDTAMKLADLLIWTRKRLREKKDWQIADEIRTRMKELGISVEDS
jgi:cysteinyl-tRNA synthetase